MVFIKFCNDTSLSDWRRAVLIWFFTGNWSFKRTSWFYSKFVFLCYSLPLVGLNIFLSFSPRLVIYFFLKESYQYISLIPVFFLFLSFHLYNWIRQRKLISFIHVCFVLCSQSLLLVLDMTLWHKAYTSQTHLGDIKVPVSVEKKTRVKPREN